MIQASQFVGPLGGLLCIAWAMGAISGYVFHYKTVHKMYKKIADTKYEAFEDRIKTLDTLNKELMFRNVVLEDRSHVAN